MQDVNLCLVTVDVVKYYIQARFGVSSSHNVQSKILTFRKTLAKRFLTKESSGSKFRSHL